MFIKKFNKFIIYAYEYRLLQTKKRKNKHFIKELGFSYTRTLFYKSKV